MLAFESVLRALTEANVRFVIVGGVAVVLQGYVRGTIDIDLAVELEPENLRRAIGALAALGYIPRVPEDPALLADAEARESWRLDKGMLAFAFIHPHNTIEIIDVMIHGPILFDDLMARADEATYGEVKVKVASIEDLLTMKRVAGRTKDRDDIEHLEAVRELRSEDVDE